MTETWPRIYSNGIRCTRGYALLPPDAFAFSA
jgi:hypothetical protein